MVDAGSVGVVAGQQLYKADNGSEALVLVRTNEEFSVCSVEREELELEVDYSQVGERCTGETGDQVRHSPEPAYTAVQVCLSVLTSIPSCLVRLDSMAPHWMGDWTFTITRPGLQDDKMLTGSVVLTLWMTGDIYVLKESINPALSTEFPLPVPTTTMETITEPDTSTTDMVSYEKETVTPPREMALDSVMDRVGEGRRPLLKETLCSTSNDGPPTNNFKFT